MAPTSDFSCEVAPPGCRHVLVPRGKFARREHRCSRCSCLYCRPGEATFTPGNPVQWATVLTLVLDSGYKVVVQKVQTPCAKIGNSRVHAWIQTGHLGFIQVRLARAPMCPPKGSQLMFTWAQLSSSQVSTMTRATLVNWFGGPSRISPAPEDVDSLGRYCYTGHRLTLTPRTPEPSRTTCYGHWSKSLCTSWDA